MDGACTCFLQPLYMAWRDGRLTGDLRASKPASQPASQPVRQLAGDSKLSRARTTSPCTQTHKNTHRRRQLSLPCTAPSIKRTSLGVKSTAYVLLTAISCSIIYNATSFPPASPCPSLPPSSPAHLNSFVIIMLRVLGFPL